MGKRVYNPSDPFQSIRHAARTTGQSMYYLRNGCKDGRIPHVMCGCEYRINMRRLFEILDAESMANCTGSGGHEETSV